MRILNKRWTSGFGTGEANSTRKTTPFDWLFIPMPDCINFPFSKTYYSKVNTFCDEWGKSPNETNTNTPKIRFRKKYATSFPIYISTREGWGK